MTSRELLLLRLPRLRDAVVEGSDLASLYGGRHVDLGGLFWKIWHSFSWASTESHLIKRWNIQKGKREEGVA